MSAAGTGGGVDAFYLNPPRVSPEAQVLCACLAACALSSVNAHPAWRRLAHGRFPGMKPPRPTTRHHAARYSPPFVPRAAPSRTPPTATRHTIIVAGFACCCTAGPRAARRRRTAFAPPARTRKNFSQPRRPFHGIVNAQDGTHARFNRAAALLAQRVIGDAIAQGVNGAVQGLLRLDSREAHAMARVLVQLGLPADYVRAVTPAEASQLAGIPLHQAAWFYPGGGWVQPAASHVRMADAAHRSLLFPRHERSRLNAGHTCSV